MNQKAEMDSRKEDEFPTMCFGETNTSEVWKKWKQRFEIRLKATGKQKEADEIKIAMLLDKVGSTGIDIYNTFVFKDDFKETFENVIKLFDGYCTPLQNLTMESFKFHSIKQKEGQPFEQFVTELRTKAKTCEFNCLSCKKPFEERMLKDQLVVAIFDKTVQEKFLREPQLSLEKALEYARVVEASRESCKLLGNASTSTTALDVNVLSQSRGAPRSKKQFNCKRCGTSHFPRKCPAFGKTCEACGGFNHFSTCCFMKNQNLPKKVSAVHVNESKNIDENGEEFHLFNLRTVGAISGIKQDKNRYKEDVTIDGQHVNVKIDTGAEISVIPVKFVKDEGRIIKTSIKLITYNNTVVNPIGVLKLFVECKNNVKMEIEFAVTRENFHPIISGEDAESLNLIKRINSFEMYSDFLKKFEPQFTGLGCIPGHYKIKLKENFIGHVQANRKIPYGLQENLEKTLLDMENKNIISKVEYPTDFVNSLIIVEKPDGRIRLCIDPRQLNDQIMREHFTIPTLDDILYRLNGKSLFTVIDLSDGFWQVQLDNESADLTCFNTHKGRYRFNRLPFGLSIAPEVFQKCMVKIFGGLANVDIYFDDLIISGSNKEEHDKAVLSVMETAKKFNVKFNKKKVQHRMSEVTFMGVSISKDGIRPDKKHLKAIEALTTPKSRDHLLSMMGLLKYLTRFIPNMSKVSAPLRDLTIKTNPFVWTTIHDECLQQLKDLILGSQSLAFFDEKKDIIIQTDASNEGIGACLIQDERPIAYGSRALSKAEKNYPPIEKEMLAVLFGLEKFNQFVYGRKVEVNSDHKPLSAIYKKDLNKVPVRLQRMLLRTLKYDYSIKYLPGNKMFIADALSRHFIPDPVPDDPEMLYVVHSLSNTISITGERKAEFEDSIQKDECLKNVCMYLENSWPAKSSLGAAEKQFYKLKSELIISNGLLFFNNKLVVPRSQIRYVLEMLHIGHFGTEKTLTKARRHVYWLGMQTDIEEYLANCYICQQFKRNNCKEPLRPFPIPHRPWERVGADLFYDKNKDYLVVYDSYSGWLEVARLANKTAAHVISVLKSIFSQLGIPDNFHSDNNPFNDFKMKDFAKQYGFNHVPSSPGYPQGNGLAEKGVAIAKGIIRKSKNDEEISLGIMEYRNTPLKFIGYSPSEIINSRIMKTLLPCNTQHLKPKFVDQMLIRQRLIERQNYEIKYFNRGKRYLPGLNEGENVLLKKKLWEPAKVIKDRKDNSFIVEDMNGNVYRRNRLYLAKTRIPFVKRPNSNHLLDDCDLSENVIGSPSSSVSVLGIVNEKYNDNQNTINNFTVEENDVYESCSDSEIPINDCLNNVVENIKKTRSGRVVLKPSIYKDFCMENEMDNVD